MDNSIAIIYLDIYKGYNPVIQALKALNLMPFLGGENLIYASNNINIVKAL